MVNRKKEKRLLGLRLKRDWKPRKWDENPCENTEMSEGWFLFFILYFFMESAGLNLGILYLGSMGF